MSGGALPNATTRHPLLRCFLLKFGGEEDLTSPSPTPFALSLHLPQCGIFLLIPAGACLVSSSRCVLALHQLMPRACRYQGAKPELMSSPV